MKPFVSIAFTLAAAQVPAQSPAKPSETTELTVPSTTYPKGRHAWVYTPLGYPASCESECNLIIAFDGALYLGAMPLPPILDSLVRAKRIRPTVAVLVDNGGPPERISDLANSRQFAAFVANELLPWAREHYAITHMPEGTILAGSSAGGLAAAYIAMKYPAL